MTRYLRLLTEELEHETRQRVQRVSAALFQGLSWLHESGDPRLVRIVERHGWGLGRLEVVCDLAAFTQIVVGPLASSGLVRAKSGVGRTIPVRHGVDLRFDERGLMHVGGGARAQRFLNSSTHALYSGDSTNSEYSGASSTPLRS